ncbi:two-component system, chemotaxis family, sensor kinase CheA [Pararobbsia alpina]|uniref:chemotaxis protein CheA n=1 Tax=Pararobbsia alpina TaxID=621374 RepID=UPI0039A6757A
MNMDQALQTFIVESRELLDAMESALLRVLDEDDRSDSVNAIFRAAHTIKGSAGLFGLDFIVEFTHVVESVLDQVREAELDVGESVVTLLLACGDHIGQLVEVAARGETVPDAGLTERAQPLLEQLNRLLHREPALMESAETALASAMPSAPPRPVVPAFLSDASAQASESAHRTARHWHISLRFGPDVLRNGMDPLSFLRYLGKLGTVTHVITLTDALPPLDAMDAESCYLGLDIALLSDAEYKQIEGAFEFVIDDCDVRIVAANTPVEAPVEVPTALGQADVSAAVPPSNATEARQPQAKAHREGKPAESQSIRVDAEKLDRLVDLVGELITASASAIQAGRNVQSGALHEAHSTLLTLVEEVRDSALQLRMVKIGATFSRFQRVVHDVSREIGKDIYLQISGEDTELDKTVVEKIADPLTHLVRNSMDHGIESADVRIARGKPARGCVRLNAFHDSGSIVIEVGDDGGGLSKEKILAKAIDRGLVEPGKSLSDAEIYALIFEPGFSTADQVTNLSGRGVGMDVVKRNITALRGAVLLDSQPGQGSTVTIRLPLTLAIINGFQVAVGNSVFVLPLDSVEECVEFREDSGHDFTELREKVLPFIRLRSLFRVPGARTGRPSIVVVRHGDQRFGLIVDRLLGEAQTVIKPLARMFSHLHGISGSSILGSGEVALILDVPALADVAQGLSRQERPVLESSIQSSNS